MSLQTASMILRILVNAPLTTKGDELTWEELDGNLIKIYLDLAAKVKAGSIPDFDSGTTYSLGDAANYNDLTWLYLNAAPAAGIDPGSDPLYWGEVDPTFFIHEKDKDIMLAKGTAYEVSAEDLAALVAADPPDTLYTESGSLISDRTVNGMGYVLAFYNMLNLVLIANKNISIAGVNDGVDPTAAGVSISATAANPGDVAYSIDNGFFQAFQMFKDGKLSIPLSLLIGTGNTPIDDSLVFDVANNSSRLSRPLPPLTQSEIDALTPLNFSHCINTNYSRPQYFDPFWGWHPVGPIMPDWGYEINDENVNTNTIFSNVGTNGGVAASTTNATLSPTVLWGISTGPNINGEFRHATSNYYLGSVGKKHFKNKVSVNALSTITDRYATMVGYISTNSGIANADGMFFLYDEGGVFSTATASANWLCVCRNGGSYSVVDSGIAVTTTASALKTLEIKDYGTGVKVEFLINGVVVSTITTNIPDNTKQLYILERIVKTLGVTARTLFVDYTFAKEKFNTPR